MLQLQLFITTLIILANNNEAKIIGCYFNSGIYGRPGDGAFDVENIDPFLCTHGFYAFAAIDPATYELVAGDPGHDLPSGANAYQRFTSLAQTNPNFKPMLSVGGGSAGVSALFSTMAANPAYRQTFISSAINYLYLYGFVGLDVDWEYPTQNGGQPADFANFITLLSELRTAFGERNYILSAAVNPQRYYINLSYDVPNVARYLDFVNLMCYDEHGSWESVTGHNAPLYAAPGGTPEDLMRTVNDSVRGWLEYGAQAAKLILGTASYGRTFTLADPNNHGPSAPAVGAGNPGPNTVSAGVLAYYEVCQQSWTIIRDEYYHAPYGYRDNQWVGYDDPDSIREKCQFSTSLGLGGAMVWTIDMDDFNNKCNLGVSPIIQVLNESC